MKTRNNSVGTTLPDQGRLFRRAKQSPCSALGGKQKLTIPDDPLTNQSSLSAKKKDRSPLENVEENCISLAETMSPIIKRRIPRQSKLSDLSNMCRDSSFGCQRSEKDKKAPLQIIKGSQENQVFPVEERMNDNMSQKGKEMKEDCKKQVKKGSVISDKENVLSTDMVPVRKSKRIRVPPRSKDVLDILRPVIRKPQNKKQNETKNVPETDKVDKEEASPKVTNKQLDPHPKPKRVTNVKSPKTRSSSAQQNNVTAKSGGKKESESSHDRTCVAANAKSSCNEKESATPEEDVTVPLRRTKRKSGQQEKDNIAKKTKTGNNYETPKLPGTSTRTIRSVSSAKIDGTKGLSHKLLRRSHNTSQNKKTPTISGSQGVTQAKSKLPVWASVKSIKITPGKRKSFRINSDTYDFPSSPHEEIAEVKRKKLKKSKKPMKKRVKPRTKFTLLITDPSWQTTASKRMPLVGESSVSTTNRNTAPPRYLDDNSEMDAADEASIPSIMSSIRDEEPADFNFSGFECEVSNDLFLGFEGETRSSFVIPRNESEVIPMTSASVLPTPAISKHISKYIGVSSTPRMENVAGAAGNKKRTANDSISECFGFNDDSEEESELNISPVQQSRQRSALEVTGTSDMMDGDLHPATLPSRFSWSSLRPGNRSRVSTSRSSSMVVQGRSVTFMTDVSQNSQTKITSFAVPTVNKQHPMQRREKLDCRKKTTCQDKLQDTLSTEADPSDKIEAAEMSVLFDDEDLKEKHSEDEEPIETSHVNKASQVPAKASDKSPEKSFVKAPRRSYDRTSLLEARQKFIEMHGGYVEDGTTTEEEEEAAQVKLRSKARKKPSKPTKVTKPTKGNKRKEKKSAKAAEGSSKKTAASTSISKKKKKQDEYDATLENWASRINSHFSEVDESLLVVE
ncbi:uncharacterized protein LOC123504795 isoform X2 [Portunus trituberculatus]|uniref:uncharacterized protein LOC123504795 isoform X2 n=1 Tax=Portunus trituberculatus TaxID=210409 RepID=UPI001E1D1D82|nr:uncharacterized protein LOC123504795 isoform X2 [Portunus trituberculatus]